MSYYPILMAPGCTGQTTLYNFPPNNWEMTNRQSRLINLTWAQDNVWHSEVLGELAFGAMRIFSHADIPSHVPADALPLLSFSTAPLPLSSEVLPSSMHNTSMPAWRATLGLVSAMASTCYQGELDPFPTPGSMLTFAPFMQLGSAIENYMLMINLEKTPQIRASMVEVYDSANPHRLKGSFEVRNNTVSVVRLDGLDIGPDVLPVIICKEMSGIPLYFSKTHDGTYLSLEHTHPPASYVIHGQRWDAQKILKKYWFARLGQA